MIVVYTSPGCASCRKVKKWLSERNIKYVEKNIFSTLLNDDEIKELLIRSENGTDDIISKRSKIFQEGRIDVDEMKVNELISFIRQNPSILRRPIIINEKAFQVGFDEEEIDAFVPSELRSFANIPCNDSCSNYPVCGKLKSCDNCSQ